MKQLHPRAIWLFFLTSLARIGVWLLIILVYLSFISLELRSTDLSLSAQEESNASLIWTLLWGVGIVAVLYVWARLTWYFYKYQLTETDVRKESGVIVKAYVSIPYDRIQNVDIYRGVIARLLGLSDLHIQTAGTSATFSRYGGSGLGAEGRVPGLLAADAEALREELIQRSRRPSPQSQSGV